MANKSMIKELIILVDLFFTDIENFKHQFKYFCGLIKHSLIDIS